MQSSFSSGLQIFIDFFRTGISESGLPHGKAISAGPTTKSSIDKPQLKTTFKDNLGVNLSTTSKYKCHSCGYSADVWDAPDKAPIATVDTRHCMGCKSLVEVPIVFHGGGLIADPDVTPSFLNRCPDCNSMNVQPWDAKHPCPKCGEHMTMADQG